MTSTATCPQCGDGAAHAFDATDSNRRIGSGVFSYMRCQACGVVFLSNVPPDLSRYYPEDYYTIARSHEELQTWSHFERYKLDIILNYRTTGRLIEIGPASGAFAYLAKTAGFDVTAIEMDRRCAEYLSSKLGIGVIHSADEANALKTAGTADVIAMWHVIEHLVDPWSMLSVAAGSLRPGGILVVAAPNPQAFQFRLLSASWAHVDAPRHLWLIPMGVIGERGAKAGLAVRLATTRDAGSLFWNRFGWQQSLANRFASSSCRRVASLAGRGIALAASVLESREGWGSAYTLVLQKPGG